MFIFCVLFFSVCIIVILVYKDNGICSGFCVEGGLDNVV